jgi:hypothetical protein
MPAARAPAGSVSYQTLTLLEAGKPAPVMVSVELFAGVVARQVHGRIGPIEADADIWRVRPRPSDRPVHVD